MNWSEIQGRAPTLRSLLRFPRGARSVLSRDGDNSGPEENQNQEIVTLLTSYDGQTGEGSFGGQQSANRRSINSSRGVEEREREQIRRGSGSWGIDLEEGGGGIEARSPELPRGESSAHILGRSDGGSTGQQWSTENMAEHLNLSIDATDFLVEVFSCSSFLSGDNVVNDHVSNPFDDLFFFD